MEPLDLAVRLAQTGTLDPLRCGMTLDEVQELLGPYHDRMDESRPRRWKPRLHFWEDLEVTICHDLVAAFMIPFWRDTLAMPRQLTGWAQPRPSRVPYQAALDALAAAGVEWVEAPEEGLGDSRAIKAVSSSVVIVFWTGSDGSFQLYKVFASAPASCVAT